MMCKDNWNETKHRLSALWNHERLDRPCVSVQAPAKKNTENKTALPVPANAEARWLDPAYWLAHAQHKMQHTWWGGEAIPSELIMSGWVQCLGGTPHFAEETIWFETRPVDFKKPSPFRHDPGNPWTAKYHAMLEKILETAGRDNFLVGSPCILPANDLISMHMGTQDFLVALIDHPDWMAEAILEGARSQASARRATESLIREKHEFWYGNAGWMPFWSPEPYAGSQSDVSCMLSPEMFRRFVIPELEVSGGEFNALWYHLDGGDARQHLPALLDLPYLRVLQYTAAPFEPPNGPAHMEFYRQIQSAGKIVHIQVPVQNIEPIVRELDPALLMIDTWCANRSEGEQLLENCKAWSASARPAEKR